MPLGFDWICLGAFSARQRDRDGADERGFAMKRLIGLMLLVIASAARGEALFPAPSFVLTDQEGRQVSNQDLRGKVWIVDFIFTRCMGPCPMMTQKLVRLAKDIESPSVRFVSISVDPEFDRPAVLKQYARDRGATDPR